jgi:hypothetical protein
MYISGSGLTRQTSFLGLLPRHLPSRTTPAQVPTASAASALHMNSFEDTDEYEDDREGDAPVGNDDGDGDDEGGYDGDTTLQAPPNLPQHAPHSHHQQHAFLASQTTLAPNVHQQGILPHANTLDQPQLEQHQLQMSQFSIAALAAAQANLPSGISADELNRRLTTPTHMVCLQIQIHFILSNLLAGCRATN